MDTPQAHPPVPALAVSRLRKVYGEVEAVRDVSFTVPQGVTTALLGGNGAGKTTTISMLLGLLLPTSGEISVLGIDMLKNRHAALPLMNFSSPYVDVPARLTVRENLTVYAGLYGLARPKERLEQLAEELELTTFFNRRCGRLSAGQKTRVALAKALVNQPRVLLLDEPTASLDPDTGDWIRQYLQGYARNSGATLFLASHNMNEVERMCAQVLVMRDGRIFDQGSPQGLVERYPHCQTLEDVFLEIARAPSPCRTPDSRTPDSCTPDSGHTPEVPADPAGRES